MNGQSGRPLALITGASSGIGKGFAVRLAAEGYDLVLAARRVERMQAIARELCEIHGVEVEVMRADLADDVQLAAVEERLRLEPRLAMLVNNAGFMTPLRFADAPVDTWDGMTRVHMLATVRLSHAALTGMLARGRGDLINVASIAAFVPMPRNVMYTATKRFLVSFTEGLFQETVGTGVRVQALCPGWTRTEIVADERIDTSRIGNWSTVDDVVDASLRGLRRRKLVVIPGWYSRLLVMLTHLTWRPLLRWIIRRTRTQQVTMKDE
jgi:short-subunit dehydrogenase